MASVCVLSTYLTKQGCVNPPSLRHFESNNEKSCRCYICSENDKWWKAFATQCLQMSRNIPFQFSCQNSEGMDIADFQNCSTTSEVTGGQKLKIGKLKESILRSFSTNKINSVPTSEATRGQNTDQFIKGCIFEVAAEFQS